MKPLQKTHKIELECQNPWKNELTRNKNVQVWTFPSKWNVVNNNVVEWMSENESELENYYSMGDEELEWYSQVKSSSYMCQKSPHS